jgi:hypothetical protein
MPNWCSNVLNVYKREDSKQCQKEFDAFVNGIMSDAPNESPLTMAKLVPPPDDIVKIEHPNETQKQRFLDLYGVSGWYDWNIANWGCKWDISEGGVNNKEEGVFECSFDTPWGPPDAFIRKVIEMFPNLFFSLQFIEEGCAFAGEITSDGECEYEHGSEDYIRLSNEVGYGWEEQDDEE